MTIEVPNETSTRFADLCNLFWKFQCEEFPLTAIMEGKQVSHDLMLREAPADQQRRALLAMSLLHGLDVVSTDDLNSQDHVGNKILARDISNVSG
jgi:hypothetical protein